MLFCTQEFLLFFTIVLLAYWALPWHRARVWLLLAASFYFYASWNHWLAIIVCVSSTLDYLLARGMDAFTSSTPTSSCGHWKTPSAPPGPVLPCRS